MAATTLAATALVKTAETTGTTTETEFEFLSIDWEANLQQLQKISQYKSDPTVQNLLNGIVARLFFFLNRERAYLKQIKEIHVDQYVKSEAKIRFFAELPKNYQPTATNAFENARQKILEDAIRPSIQEENAREVKEINIKLQKLSQIEHSLKKFQLENGINNTVVSHPYDPYLVELESKLILAQHFMQLKDHKALANVLKDFSTVESSLSAKYYEKRTTKTSQIESMAKMIEACRLMNSDSVQPKDVLIDQQELAWCELIINRLNQIRKEYLQLRAQYQNLKKASVPAKISPNVNASSNTAANSSVEMIFSGGPRDVEKTQGSFVESSTATASTAVATGVMEPIKPSNTVPQNK